MQELSITFKLYKQYLTLSISANSQDFADATGLLDAFPIGKIISRDGQVFDNFVELGIEWQVVPDDGKFFYLLP